jgi:hypothetical protein
LRFRQVHLDFHTSEAIPNIGVEFSAAQFQAQLQRGHVDSITVFSKCHHGWAYHPSEANETHPHLAFDLLGAQIDAAHAVGVKTPVYLSAGLDEKEARRHPEWLLRNADDRTNWVDSFLKPGYHQFCMNTPYLDILTAQIEEVVQSYDADGIFLDIVGVRPCLCHACLAALQAEGSDPEDPAAVLALAERVYAEYARRTNDAVHVHKPGLPVFHNGGHIKRGRRDLAHFNTHLELESLPTGGWGYDHFPLSARYAGTLGMDFLGMTGKFHTSWGEFGGFKHPNALRYEAALSLAMGAKCSIGDQLHPSGTMDSATYALIGAAYAETEPKEPWCEGAVNIADVALLSLEAAGQERAAQSHTGKSDAGAVRMLLEGHFLFDVVDAEADFCRYKVLVLPDYLRLTPDLAAKIKDFVAGGGQVFATGESGLNESGKAFTLDFGVRWIGQSEFRPDYFRPIWTPEPLEQASFVLYAPGQKIEVLSGTIEVLGHREEPYFNREWRHFSSHQHTPSTGQEAGLGLVRGPDGIYFAWAVFEDYATKGSLICRKIAEHTLNLLLPEKTLTTDLPAQGVTTLTEQPILNRYVHHLLYASPVRRGDGIEVIEDLVTLADIHVSLRLPRPVSRVSLAPQGTDLPFVQDGDIVSYVLPCLECHQMVVLQK